MPARFAFGGAGVFIILLPEGDSRRVKSKSNDKVGGVTAPSAYETKRPLDETTPRARRRRARAVGVHCGDRTKSLRS